VAVRLLKCYGFCNEKHPKEDLVKVGTQNFCKPCAEKKAKITKDRDILYKTIQTVFKIPYPTGFMLKQIKDFQEQKNYELEGITKTICYFLKVQQKEPSYKAGLSFVTWHYDSAIEYYNKLEERRNNIKDDDGVKVIKLTIKPLKPSKSNELLRQKRIIDLGGILNDG
jgi:hypothetical protein